CLGRLPTGRACTASATVPRLRAHRPWPTWPNRGKLTLMSAAQSSQILDRLLDPVAECLTPDVARALVNLRARPEDQARIDELAARRSEGELTPAEQAEYRDIVEAIDF